MTVSTDLDLEPMDLNLSPRKKLENHLRKLLVDERFFDISLKCSDNEILRACKNILAARSEVFNDHIFNNSKKNINQQQQQLEFNEINSIAMKYILEYLYTSRNEKEKLYINNVVEIYYSSIYFKLEDLQNDIIEFVKNTLRNGDEELGKNLLSAYIEKFTLKADNIMGTILVDWVAKIQLFPEEADRDLLSLEGLQYLLMKTYNTVKSFATYELELFEYTFIKTKQIVLEEKIGSKKDPYNMNYDSNTLERIKDRFKPLIPYIDLRIIDPDDVIGKLEPLKIFPEEMITEAYRYRIKIKHEELQPIRGRLIFKWKNFDKEFWQAENKLYITNNGFTVGADSNLKKYQPVMGNLFIKGNGIHRWDIFIENLNDTVYIGICGIEDKFEKPGEGFQGCALGSDGYVYNKRNYKWNNSVFKTGDVVNIVINMNAKHCYFGVNNNINYENFGYSFPDEIYPFVSLKKGSKVLVRSY
ncbi:hypothetical protein C1645_731263 [Glomus cerebriforme]|uniref:Concanavalin A-like lectin/glucanase domain-containing protein n=1 Tax=Glomus cerebriforme TaxID=658196 RepID=A0A397TPQ8_9GLOM|nr:hypothetical protein C1645_731263 [Glomus cerebriforme]